MRRKILFVTILSATAGAAGAQQVPLAERALAFKVGCCTAPPGWIRIDAGRLDSQRGGFDLPSGLTMSLGIERLVSINGQLVSQSSFNIANVTTITAAEATQVRSVLGSPLLVQNGAGNFASLPSSAGTFVQNTLDGQTIAASTIINASVNSASMLKNLNFNSSVIDAGLRGIPTH